MLKPAVDGASEAAPSERSDEDATSGELRARNVQVAYWFTLLAGVARGVWSYAVLSGYLRARRVRFPEPDRARPRRAGKAVPRPY